MSVTHILTSYKRGLREQPLLCTFLLVLLAVCVGLYYPSGTILKLGPIAAIGGLVLCYVLVYGLRGQVEGFLLIWVLLFPLGYYFLSFPRKRALLTMDRMTVCTLLLGIIFAQRKSITRVGGELRRAALAWGGFLIVGLISLTRAEDLASALHIFVDAFILPVFLGWYVIRSFPPVRKHLRTFHILISLMSIYVSAIGAAEMVLGKDLLPLTGAGLYFAGTTGFQLLRPNGPFLTSNSYSLIGIVSVLLLLFLRPLLPQPVAAWQRALHVIGVSSGIATALMPLSRGIFLIVLLIMVLDFLPATRKRRMGYATVVLLVIALLFVAYTKHQGLYEERVSNPANLYARIAQQRQTLEEFQAHPLIGAGLGNFMQAAEAQGFDAYFHGIESMDTPHNNLAEILTDFGLLGFLPYVLAQIFIFKAFWKVRSLKTPAARLVWKSFLYIFLAYWISGLNVGSGYYSDINLWYIFALMLLYRWATEAGSEAPQPC